MTTEQIAAVLETAAGEAFERVNETAKAFAADKANQQKLCNAGYDRPCGAPAKYKAGDQYRCQRHIEVGATYTDPNEPSEDMSGVSTNLYVYPDGQWLIDNNDTLQDHNTLAQAPATIEYADAAALVAALGETVADDAASDETTDADPETPDEEDITTPDGLQFFQDGKKIFVVSEDDAPEAMWELYETWCANHNFYPDVWQLDDHGGATLLKRPEEPAAV